MSLWSLVFWVEAMDYISLVLEVEGIVYGCYVKYGRVQNVSVPPHHQLLSQHPKIFHGILNDPIELLRITPLYIDINVSNVGATIETK
jgi:hypothetical protein